MSIRTIHKLDTQSFTKLPDWMLFSSAGRQLSLMEKVLYAVLLKRESLSKKNNWVDEDGAVYIYFTQTKLAEMLQVSKSSIKLAMKHLEDLKLIQTVVEALGKPKKIYLCDPDFDVSFDDDAPEEEIFTGDDKANSDEERDVCVQDDALRCDSDDADAMVSESDKDAGETAVIDLRSASMGLPKADGSAPPEDESAKEDVSSPKPRRDDAEDVEEVFQAFRFYAQQDNVGWPVPTMLTEERKKKIRSRLRKLGKEKLLQAMHEAAKSDFLCGDLEHSSWVMDFDWFLRRDEHVLRILEGRYRNRQKRIPPDEDWSNPDNLWLTKPENIV